MFSDEINDEIPFTDPEISAEVERELTKPPPKMEQYRRDLESRKQVQKAKRDLEAQRWDELYDKFSTDLIQNDHDPETIKQIQTFRYEVLIRKQREELEKGGPEANKASWLILEIMREQNKMLGISPEPRGNRNGKGNAIPVKDLNLNVGRKPIVDADT